MASFQPVRSVLRALELLTLLNRRRESSLLDLHHETGLPKPTLIRLLETLLSAGYVMQISDRGKYRVTNLVRHLSVGYYGVPLIAEASRATATELTHRVKWPISVSVLDYDAMNVIFTTVSQSPISPTQQRPMSRLRILTRAHGRAFFAFSSKEQQRLVLSILKRSTHPEDKVACSNRDVAQIVSEIRRAGYAYRDPRVQPTHSNTLAIPLRSRGETVGSLGVTYFSSAMKTIEAAAQLYIPALRSAARSIERNIEALSRARDD